MIADEPTSAVRVLILHNQPVLAEDHPDADSEYEILDTAAYVKRTLTEAGHEVRTLGVGRDPGVLLDGLRRWRPDVVFNLFEGLADHGDTEAVVAGLLTWLDIPFTGSPAPALTLGHDKFRTKQLLRGAGLPTPAFFLVTELPCRPCPLEWPVIVKPALQDASVGIEQASVVTDQEQLGRRVAHVLERYGPPVLVEEFISGREFHVTVVEEGDTGAVPARMCVLPLAEIVYLKQDSAYWPIYSYDAKWKPEGWEYQMTPLHSPVALEPEPTEELQRIAQEAFRLVGCRDYARVDVRMTAAGQFSILEVNPNPFLNSIGVVNGLKALGRRHDEFLLGLIRAALTRKGRLGCPTAS